MKFHSDSARGYLSDAVRTLLTEWRVEQTNSSRDQVEMNGVAEETNKELGDTSRIVLLSSGPPILFWGFCYDAVVFVRTCPEKLRLDISLRFCNRITTRCLSHLSVGIEGVSKPSPK